MMTTINSDLYWKIIKIHYDGDKYVKAKLLFFYKSSNQICYWLNPEGVPKNFKIIKEKFNSWRSYAN